MSDREERWLELSANLLEAIHGQHRGTTGHNPLKFWEQLANRMTAATRTTATVGEWITRLYRSLQMVSPNSSRFFDGPRAVTELMAATAGRDMEFLDWMEANVTCVVATCRVNREERIEAAVAAKAEREADEAAHGREYTLRDLEKGRGPVELRVEGEVF